MKKIKKLNKGFSFIEVLIAVVILGLTMVPAMDALQISMKSSGIKTNSLRQHYALFGKMEEVLSDDFTTLDAAATAAGDEVTASSYSATVGTDQINVFLSRYDIDNADADDDPFTGVDNIIWVKSELVGTAMNFETLVMP